MSGLMNLFGNNSAPDSNDSLKYSAPKEPKKKQKASATSESKPDTGSSAPTSTAPPSNSSGPAAKTIGPSKLLVSSSVRLYRLNPTTRGYDAVEGGGLLGCIIMGSGLTFNFLIYNAQKQPQAALKLTPTFEYTVAGLYLSFSDTNNNYFSVLFDTAENMFPIVKTLSAVIVHLQSYNGDLGDLPNIKRSFPPSADQTAEDTTALTSGMTAGIYYSIWEIGDLTDYPSDIVNAAPLVQNKEPDELLKVKLSDAEEFLPGLSAALSGHKRGDRFVLAIPPKTLASKSVVKPLFEASRKKNEYAYLYVIIEISKIKSSSSSAPPASQPVATEKKRESITEDRDETLVTQANTAANTDISSRMAKMAAASGGGNTLALAGIINHKVGFESPSTESRKAVSFKDHPDNVTGIPIVPIPVKQQSDPALASSPPTTTQVVTTPVKTVQIPVQIQPQANVQPQQQYQQTQPQPQHIPLNQTQPQQQQQQQYQSYSNATSSPQSSHQPDVNQSAFAQQFNNSMMIVQQSLMQLHTKLDQVGMQVTNVYSMQQQSQTTQQQMTMTLQTLSSASVSGATGVTGGQNGNNPNANAMMMGMNPMGMPGMMNPMMGGGYHPMMFSQPGYHNPYNMYGAPMSPTPMSSGGGVAGGLTSSNPQLKYKSDEIVSNVSFLLQQYELLRQENADLKNKITTPSTPPPSTSVVRELESKINALEEEKRQLQVEKDKIKNENYVLQQEKEKLVKTIAEKTTEIDQIETSAKFKSLLQQQISAATSPLQVQIQDLTRDKASTQTLLEEEKKRALALEQEVASLHANASNSAAASTGNNEVEQALRQQISEVQALLTSLQQQVDQKDQEINTLQQQKNTGDGSSDEGKYTIDEIKGMMSDIYKLSMNTFMTEDELNNFEEESIRNHTIQLVKTILKRLKDVLRQVTTDRLG